MDEKIQFIADVLRHTLSIDELCRRYNISRKTGYKWIRRYQADGPAGLRAQRSRRPQNCPHRTAEELEVAIIEARQRHPRWGAKKLLKILSKREPPQPWPARTTICNILDRNGLIRHPRKRRQLGHPGKPAAPITSANAVWTADFKGQFRTGDGVYCYPLTVQDGDTRFLLGCQRPAADASTPVGPCSAGCSALRPARADAHRQRGRRSPRVALGALHAVGLVGAPGGAAGVDRTRRTPAEWRHERMHKTLKAETTPAAGRTPISAAPVRPFARYNPERPHEPSTRTPACCYPASPRPYRSRPPRSSIRITSNDAASATTAASVGPIAGSTSALLAKQYVGLEEIDDGVWDIYFGPMKLGRLLEEHMRIEDQFGKLKRLDR